MRPTLVLTFAAALAASLGAAAPSLAAQSEAQRLIVAAKEQLTSNASCPRGEDPSVCAARRLDSSAALLRQVTALPAARNEEKTEAWIWIGIGQFFAGREPVTRQAFREALLLSPEVQANLEQIDSTLAVILETERIKARLERSQRAQAAPAQPSGQAPPPNPTPAAATAQVPAQATTQAPPPAATPARPGAPAPAPAGADGAPDVLTEGDVSEPPQLTSRLRTQFPDDMRGRGYTQVEVLVELVVDTAGRVERNSIRVLSSPADAFGQAATRAVRDARFRPGRHEGRVVRVRVQLPVPFEAPRDDQRRADTTQVPPASPDR